MKTDDTCAYGAKYYPHLYGEGRWYSGARIADRRFALKIWIAEVGRRSAGRAPSALQHALQGDRWRA
ncbi:hypothetical protein KCP75_16585 [Salmonella enterica subsp. enterica]|nr:hypothetical protein KCP75_16585 [Salmonella enterica subsp. enterica]